MVRKTDNPTDPVGPPELPSKAALTDTVTQEQHDLVNSKNSDGIIIPKASLDTPESDAAIDAIVAEEADQILAAQDAGIEAVQADSGPTDDEVKHGHPVFWFMIVLIVAVAAIFAYLLMNPDLDLPFSA